MYEDASYYYDDTRDILGSTPAGMDLYEIYVYGEPGGCREHLGTLRVTTRMSASQWGDYRLFFQHAVAGQSPRYVPSALTCGLEHR